MMPPATGILVGDGVRGDELNLNPDRPRPGEGDEGELPRRVACAISAFKSDNELRRFFLRDFAAAFLSSPGGEAPMVLSLVVNGP